MAKSATSPTPRASAKLTVSFGLVNVPFAMKPLAETAKAVQGKYSCPDHLGAPLEQRYLCSVGTDQEHLLEQGGQITVYPHPDKTGEYVVVEKSVLDDIAEERSGVVEVQQIVDGATIDPVYFDKTYLCWPQAGGEQAFDLFAEVLRSEGKAAVSTVVLSKQTVTLIVRWAPEVEAIVAHTCRYRAQLRWADVSLVQTGAGSRGKVDEKHLEAARALLASMEGEFDTSAVVDTYTPLLQDAIRSAAGDKSVVIASPKAAAPPATSDLLATLMASVTASSKPAAKKPAAKKRPTKTAA